MTREQKLALIIGFALVLLVGVAVSDHFSQARVARLETGFVAVDERSDGIAIKLPSTGVEPAKPIQTLAATPERKSSASVGLIGDGLGKGLDTPRLRNAVDWIDRFRNQLSELPRAAETSPVVDHRPKQKVQSTSGTARWRSVRAGDTLWSIAKEQYGDGSLAGKLAAFNNASAADPDLLRIGVRLRIPPEHVLRGKPAPSKPKQIQHSQTTKTPPSTTRLYTIKPGDTLGEIAMQQLGTIKRINEIIALNPKALSDPDIVPVGATIRLPAK